MGERRESNVPVLESKIVVLEVNVEERQDELLTNLVPAGEPREGLSVGASHPQVHSSLHDASHLISVHLSIHHSGQRPIQASAAAMPRRVRR